MGGGQETGRSGGSRNCGQEAMYESRIYFNKAFKTKYSL